MDDLSGHIFIVKNVFYQSGTLVVVQAGLSQEIIFVLQCTQEIGSRLNLGVAHAVTDEQEYVLRCRYRLNHRHGGLRFRLLSTLGIVSLPGF